MTGWILWSYVILVIFVISNKATDEDYEEYEEEKQLMNQPKFNLHSTDFAEIVTTAAFVDKTMYIKTFMEDQGIVVLTAPFHFGKSTNVDMIKKFLEIEVDDEGNMMSNATSVQEPVRDTENYNIFVKNQLKITENTTFMDCHFGKYPVIHVDFWFDLIHVTNYEIAEDHLKYIIRRSYADHYYLHKSERLKPEERRLVKTWCSTTGYGKMSEKDLSDSLMLLSKFLFRHYKKRRVYVLMDNFDLPMVNAMLFAPTEGILGGIYRLVSSVLLKVLQNNVYVRGGLMSGISYLAASPALYNLGYISVGRFLENHAYSGFHGVTLDEAAQLFSNDVFNLSSVLQNKVRGYYGGYCSCSNVTLYNPWSLFRYLLVNHIQPFWKEPGIPFQFFNLPKIPVLRNEISLLMKGKERKIRLKKVYAPDEIIRFRDIVLEPDHHREMNSPDIVLTFLLELGYLTYVPTDQSFLSKKFVKIPNKEIFKLINRVMKEYERSKITGESNEAIKYCKNYLIRDT